MPMEEIVNDVLRGDKDYLTQAEYSYWSDEVYDGVYDAALSEAAWALTMSQPTDVHRFRRRACSSRWSRCRPSARRPWP
ncbi:MAG: hypothetical protein MZU97_22225 [Bacillus subtilis]|nr:hypothetical protein [Bacillus subtilis]